MNPWLERLRQACLEGAPSAGNLEDEQGEQGDIVAVKVWSEVLSTAIWVVTDDLPQEQWPTDAPVYPYTEMKLLTDIGPDGLSWVHFVKTLFNASLVVR